MDKKLILLFSHKLTPNQVIKTSVFEHRGFYRY